MDFTTTDIKTFKRLYMKYFNIRLNDKLARLKLAMLVRQMEITYQPITKEQLEKLSNADENDKQYKKLLST